MYLNSKVCEVIVKEAKEWKDARDKAKGMPTTKEISERIENEVIMNEIIRVRYDLIGGDVEAAGRLTVVKESDKYVREFKYNEEERMVVYQRDEKIVIEFKNPIRDLAFELVSEIKIWVRPVKIGEKHYQLELVSGKIVRCDEEAKVKKPAVKPMPKPKMNAVNVNEVSVMVNEYCAGSKEDAVKHMGLISMRARGHETKEVSISIDGLVDLINKGHSIYCSVMNLKGGESVKDEQFIYQQVFGVDIDHTNLSIEGLLESLPYEPSVIYTTFSHKESEPRYRVLFVSKDVVENDKDAKQVRQHLISVIPGADEKCINASRIFFAGSVVYVNKHAEFDAKRLIGECFEWDVEVGTPSHSISENDPIKDVICANLKAMKKTYGNRIVKNSYEINDLLGRIPLGVVLGLGKKVGEKFNCVLDGHADSNASANIYLTKGGYYMYKCFGCDSSLYLTDFIDRETVCEILNIRTMWYENNKDMIAYNRKVLENPEVMVGEYHNVYKKVVAYYKLSSVLLDLAEEQLERLGRTFTTDKVDNVIISERYSEIGKRIAEKFLTVKGDRKNVQNQLDILMLMRFVVKLTDEELAQLNPVMLRRNKRNVKSFDPKYNTQYGIMINKWNMITLTDAEDMLVYYKNLGATTLGASQRQSLELGCDTRSKNNKSNDTEVLLNIKQCLIDYYEECVNTKGYVLKDEFMAYAKENNTGRKLASTFIAMLNKQYGLTSAIVNKNLISQHEELSAADSKKRIFLAAA